ncbi:MAG: sigma-70 family RNA polymerase sigma factor [Anaerolineae bacterium]
MTISNYSATLNHARIQCPPKEVPRERSRDRERDFCYRRATDVELIEACLDGEQAAWNELVDRYKWLVYSVARRSGLSATDIDDAFQNVFTIVFRRLSSVRNHESLPAWVVTIARRECFHIGKSLPVGQDLDDDIAEEASGRGEPFVDEIHRWERQNMVRAAMDQLDPRSRTLLEALFLEVPTPSYQEIASRLDIPEGSIGPTRARAVKKLENILEVMGIDNLL